MRKPFKPLNILFALLLFIVQPEGFSTKTTTSNKSTTAPLQETLQTKKPPSPVISQTKMSPSPVTLQATAPNTLLSTVSKRLSTTMQCEENNGVIFLVFAIPNSWLEKPDYRENAIKISYYGKNGKCLLHPSRGKSKVKWIYTDSFVRNRKQLVARLGRYTDPHVAKPACLRLSMETGISSLSVQRFHYKNVTKIFRSWDVIQQEKCFGNPHPKKVKLFHVKQECRAKNIIVEWLNYDYAFLWYIFTQKLQVRKVSTNQLVYQRKIIISSARNNETVFDKTPNTNYSVCLSTDEDFPLNFHCKQICFCCKQIAQDVAVEGETLTISWLETLLIVISAVSALFGFVMFVLYYRRRKPDTNKASSTTTTTTTKPISQCTKSRSNNLIAPRLCDQDDLIAQWSSSNGRTITNSINSSSGEEKQLYHYYFEIPTTNGSYDNQKSEWFHSRIVRHGTPSQTYQRTASQTSSYDADDYMIYE